MKRYIALILIIPLLVGFSTSARIAGRMGGQVSGTYFDNTPNPLGIDGLTFYKDFTTGSTDLNADYSLGSPIATFTRASGAGSWVDVNGKVNTFTTGNTNIPRFAGGYYDETGFHSGNSGVMIEGTITNRATYSYIPENAAWTKSNITADNDDSGSTSPDGTSTSPSLTATDANGTFTQSYVDATAGVYTASLWIKRKTGTGTINLRANTGDAYTDITSYVGSSWTRVSVTSSSLTNPTFDLQLVTNTDAVYIWGCQLEKLPIMTSYIPCPTTASTRQAETLKYLINNNITANENFFFRFIPFGTFSNDNTTRNLGDTDTKQRVYGRKITTGSTPLIRPNTTDAGSVAATATTQPLTNKSYVLFGRFNAISPQATVYINGIQESTSSTNNWNGVIGWGDYFYVGSDKNSDNQLNGVISHIGHFDRQLTDSEISNLVFF